MGYVILGEATLSFLGFGVPPPTPSWGLMLAGTGRQYMLQSPWLALWPGICLVVVVYGINMLGDAVRDILDPRLRGGLGRYGGAEKDIAKKLKVSDGTIRFRTRRMIRKNILRITASINPFALENSILALVGMQLERRTHKKTMETISKLRGVMSVCNATGRYDLLVEVFLDSQRELNRFLMEDLSRIGGINTTETFIYLDAINKWVELC